MVWKWLSDNFRRSRPERSGAEPFFVNVYIAVINMPENFVNITGGTIGALNVSGTQTVHSIDMKIGELLNNPNSQEFAKALKEMTEAMLKASALTESQREMALGQLEVLGQQASAPADKRNKPTLNALVNTLANVCAGAGGLAAAWQMWGPVINKFFGV